MSSKIEIFRKEFDKEWFLEFRKSYESINSDRPIETDNTSFKKTEKSFRKRSGKNRFSKRSFCK